MDEYSTILSKATPFLEKVFTALEKDGIDVSQYHLDHMCYRVETNERYDQLVTLFSLHADTLAIAEINGRQIATFKLHKPFYFYNRVIDCIEVPAPSSKKHYDEGFQHVEFVITEDFSTFKKRYQYITFDNSNEHNDTNPDIAIPYTDFIVKFHQHTLEYIVQYIQK